jgi:integrase
MAIRSYVKDGVRYFEAYVNGFDSQGRRIQRKRRGIETHKKAETVEFELKRELAIRKEQPVSYRFGEWFDECMRRMRLEFMPSTLAGYETQVVKWAYPLWKHRELADISKADAFELVFNHAAEIRSQRTRQNVLKRLRRIFQMAVEEGVLQRNPCVGIKVRVPEALQKVLTPSEADLFLREARLANHRFYPVWVVALMTGMRSGELYALKWTDVDFDGRMISVSRAWNSKCGITPTKTRRSRVVPISDDLLAFLRECKLKHGADSEYVLPRLGEWTQGEQAKVTREFCQAVGITKVRFHDLRATFITNLLSRGESLARVMSIVGHCELKTTNGYLRKAGVDVHGGTDKLSYKIPKLEEAKLIPFLRLDS